MPTGLQARYGTGISWILCCVLLVISRELAVAELHCPEHCQCDGEKGLVDCSIVNVPYVTDTVASAALLDSLARDYTPGELGHLHILRLENLGESRLQWSSAPARFTNMTELRGLYLGGNGITRITPQTFAPLVKLEKLDISRNNLSEISQGTFGATTTLVHLNMSYNDIETVAEGAFGSLSELRHLDMSHNPLRQLPEYTFQKLTKLQYLLLSHTELTVLHASYFSYSALFISIDLTSNQITTIKTSTVDTLKPLEYLQAFDLSENPLICNCKLLAFRQWLGKAPVNSSATCGSPKNLAGKQAEDIAISNFRCRQPQQSAKKTTLSYFDDKPTIGPLVYNPQLGWYTGGTLSAMLFMFLVCVGLDRFKRHLVKAYKRKKLARIKLKYKQDRANGEADYDADLESLNSCQASAVTPAAVAAAFHEQYLSIINYNHQFKSNLKPHQLVYPENQAGALEDASLSSSRDLDASRTELSKDNTAQRNLVDPNAQSQEKIAMKQRIELNERSRRDVSSARGSTSRDNGGGGDEFLGVTVLEVHPDCPVHSSLGASPRLQREHR